MIDKLIIFDWGGVIESHNSQEYNHIKATIDFFKSLGVKLSDEEIFSRYHACCNELKDMSSKEELFSAIKKEFHLTCNIEEYTKKYEEHLSRIEYYHEVVAFAHSLKGKCQIGIFSNLTPFDKTRINNQVDLSAFNYVWLSFEIGYRKPQKEIYDIVENSIDIDSNRIMFIDDTEENLVAAREKGWHTCRATGDEIAKIEEKVKQFLEKK